MFDIGDIVNIVGSFEIFAEQLSISFTGTAAERKDGIIIISGSIDADAAQSLDFMKPYRIIGLINGISITLINAYVLCSFRYCSEKTFCSVRVESSEIVIGRSITDEGHIKAAYMELPEINWFFTDRQFKEHRGFSRNNPVLLEYAYPEDIVVTDEYGTLRISRTMKQSFERTEICYSSVPVLEYVFSEPVSMEIARMQIAKVRNLFLYFADGYLPLHSIKMADRSTEDYYPGYCDFQMLFNSIEDGHPVDEPFFVTSDITKDSFQEIWTNWNDIHSHKFISILFYEVIRKRSTRVNQFLNFAQAIELYENTYCADRLKKNNRGEPSFKECILDALKQLQTSFSLSMSQIEAVSEAIKESRHFFTHYSNNHIEPSYHEVFAMSRVLHLVLLGLIYRKLGISYKALENALNSREFTVFRRDIAVIQKEAIPNIDYNDYF